MSIYTKCGDAGQTDLQRGRVSKGEPVFELLGDLDELSCAIGVANHAEDSEWIEIQTRLLDMGSVISGYMPEFQHPVKPLEDWIDQITAKLDKLKNFVIPIGASSHWHLARAICRRAERRFWSIHTNPKTTEIGTYLNRLSDLLFQQARLVAGGDVRYQEVKGTF